MPESPKPFIPVRFYVSRAGDVPVRDWMASLSRDDRRKIGAALWDLQTGWPVGLPTCRPLTKGLWEIRTNLPGRTARVLFCFHDGSLIVLSAFIKKTQKTPASELDLALKRLAEIKT